NGFRKERPAIILTPTGQIAGDNPIVVMCITTRYPEPPPSNHVPLPWHADPRRVATRLARRSAAVLDWLDTLYPDEVLAIKGEVPRKLMEVIQQHLAAMHGRADPEEEP